PFFRAIEDCFAKAGGGTSLARWDVALRHGKRRLRLELLLLDGSTARPDPPLNFGVTDSATGHPVDFEKNMREVVESKGMSEALLYLQERAIRRNRFLYASDGRIASAEGSAERFVLGAKKRVMLLLGVFCLIFPYRTKALFVQQVLDAFLLMLRKVEKEDISW
ncbi:hypothetical protein KAR02_05055, partial [Candidatus Bipolaricaulota bacterium]|nr:hypothetical protein [Candidatus Bipolaricaulota bacterium]